MSKNVTPIAIFALAISYTLVGCGGGAGSNPIRMAKRAVVADEYAFEHNGCSTGKHKFNGSTKVEVLNKKCEALRDSGLNKSCAEVLRKAEFVKNCKGPWEQANPQTESVNKTTSVITSIQTSNVDDTKIESKLQTSLHVLTENSLVIRVLNKDLEKSEDKEFFIGLIKNMDFCSLSNLGSACFDSTPNGIREVLVKNAASYNYIVELQSLGRNLSPVLLSFEIVGEIQNGSFDTKNATVRSVTILESLVKPRRESLTEYIKKSANVREIAVLEIASRNATADLIKSKLDKPSNLRELIHMAKLYDKDATTYLNAFIKNKSDLVLKSQDFLYQQHFISLLLDNAKVIGSETQVLVNQLLSSPDNAVKKAAGTFLFQESSQNPDLRLLAIGSLDHPMWQVRRAAVIGLSNSNLSKAEENQILGLLADVSEVKNLVLHVAMEKFQLTSENMQTLENLQRSTQQSREDIFLLLKKNEDNSAAQVLISMLEGAENSMSRRLFEELNRRTLNSENRMHLRKIIEVERNSEDARVYAVRLLAKINSAESKKDLQELQAVVKTISVKEELEYALK